MSNVKTKQVTKKAPTVPTSTEDIFDSAFAIPSQILNEIKEKNLAHRWINGTAFKQQFGFHKNRWQPFKSDYVKNLSSGVFGGDPEGYFRRGDLILAVKPKELQDKHKAYLKDRLESTKGIKTKHKEALREIAKEHGVRTEIDNSYDENDEE